MITFDPDPRALCACYGLEWLPLWKPEPAVFLECLAAFGEPAFEHQNLKPFMIRDVEAGIGVPKLDTHAFSCVVIEWLFLNTRSALNGGKAAHIGVDCDLGAVSLNLAAAFAASLA